MATTNTVEAPITGLIHQIEGLINISTNAVASNIAHVVTPLVSAGFGVYILMLIIGAWQGSELSHPAELIKRMVSWALIITFGLNAATYTSTVVPIFLGIPDDLAAALPNATPNQNSLDTMMLAVVNLINSGFKTLNTLDLWDGAANYFLLALKEMVLLFSVIPFLIVATVFILIAKIGMTIIVMTGPIFFALMLFPATRQYFSAWLSTAFSYALMPLMVSVITAIAVGILNSFSGSDNLDNLGLLDLMSYAFTSIILTYMLLKVSSLASSLSAGGINDGGMGGISRGARSAGAFGARGGIAGYKMLKARRERKAKEEKGGDIKAG